MGMAQWVRKLVVRGRRAVKYFSAESWPTPPDEPQRSDSALRGQHYGFVSEMPENGEVIAVAVNGGGNNLVSVAELFPGEPELVNGEVLLWSKFGQRVLLKENGSIVVFPASGSEVLLGVDNVGGADRVVTEGKLNQKLALVAAHEHAVSGALASPSSTLSGSALVVSGSPNVYAKKP